MKDRLDALVLAMDASGSVAVLVGWVTTEVGRQPFTVSRPLRTVESASPLAAPAVATALLAFVVYFVLFGVGVWYLLHLMKHAPQFGEPPVEADLAHPIRTAGITPASAIMAEEAERARP